MFQNTVYSSPSGIKYFVPSKELISVEQIIKSSNAKMAYKMAIIGALLGDAKGTSTEFVERVDINNIYSDALNTTWINFKDKHRSRFHCGFGTDDTAQLYMYINTLAKNTTNKFDHKDYSNFILLLLRWFSGGLPEIGHPECQGIGNLTFNVLKYLMSNIKKAVRNDEIIWKNNVTQDMIYQYKEEFELTNELVNNIDSFKNFDFFTPAKLAWKQILRNDKFKPQPNGAVMRTSVLGFTRDLDIAFHNTKQLASLTHYDINCTASCLVIVGLMNYILYNDIYNVDFHDVLTTIINSVKKYVYANTDTDIDTDNDFDLDSFDKYCNIKNLSELVHEIDGQKMGYTYICMACGIFALRKVFDINTKNVKNINNIFDPILDITKMGGDADTNATVAGALVGAYYGRIKDDNKDIIFDFSHNLFKVPKELYEMYFNCCHDLLQNL